MSILATNDKARYDYELLTRYEAGLVLTGQETKSAKFGGMKLKGAHVVFHGGEAFLIGSRIDPFQKAGKLEEYDPERSRKLLMHKQELTKIRSKLEEKGLTVVPIRVYLKDGRIKVEVAVARGKKEFEKRDTIKKRELDRRVRHALKGRR